MLQIRWIFKKGGKKEGTGRKGRREGWKRRKKRKSNNKIKPKHKLFINFKMCFIIRGRKKCKIKISPPWWLRR